MLLTIDVGNTQTVLGVFDDDELVYRWRIATRKTNTADELRLKLSPLLEGEHLDLASIDGSAIASVVPALTASWEQALSHLLGFAPLICSAAVAGDLFPNDYGNPSEIGADRIADAVAAKAIYGSPVLVVDFGTATNIEVIDEDGVFCGGIIAPGLETSAAALFSHATKLPTIDLVAPGNVVGRDTISAMQSGIVLGEADRVDGLVNRIFEELGYPASVIATGGRATSIAPLCRTITQVDEDLTLKGLRLIYEAASL